MFLQNLSSLNVDQQKRYHEVAVVGDQQEKLLQIKSLLDKLEIPVFLFLVGDIKFRQKVEPEIILLESISKIEDYFPTENNRIYLACFE